MIFDEIKDQITSEKIAKDCSFKPEINPVSEAIAQQKKLMNSGGHSMKKLEDKLYEDAFDRLQKKEELKIL